jgi:hypothetical protein
MRTREFKRDNLPPELDKNPISKEFKIIDKDPTQYDLNN